MTDQRVEAVGVPAGMPEGTPPVPDPPAIPGLRFRGIVLPDDLQPICDLGNTSNLHDATDEYDEPAELANWLSHDARRDPGRDILLAEIGGRQVAMAIGGWELDNDGSRNYGTWGVVHPDWRRRGLGGALLRWVEARQRQVAATHPAEVPKRLESWSFVQETGRNALLEGSGYGPIRHWFEMERPDLEAIPPVPLPEGIEFRPAREEDLRAVFDVEVTAFRDHFGGIDDTPEAYQRLVNDPRRELSLWVLAWHGDRIVGQARNRINRAQNEALGVSRGRVNAVAVRRDWRRQGIGRSIVAESLRVLKRAGVAGATLGVDAENPHGALGIYEGIGFRITKQGRIYRKELQPALREPS